MLDLFVWYAEYDLGSYRLPYAALTVLSAAVVAGVGGWALTRALAADRRAGPVPRRP